MTRKTIIGMGLGAVASAVLAATTVSPAQADCKHVAPLQFKNGKFRIMQFADIQDDHLIEPRSIDLMNAALDAYKPDLVVFSGDNITGGQIASNAQVRQAINNIIWPVERRHIRWIATFGNHDEDSKGANNGAVTWGEPEQYNHYRHFSCNVNPVSAPGITGDSNAVALVYGTTYDATKPKYAIWVLDTGRYPANPDAIAGQRINARDNTWDHLKIDQVDWYRRRSEQFEATFGGKIPGLMWFHHPTPEFDYMWNNDYGTGHPTDQTGLANPVIPPYSANDPAPDTNNRHKIVGERNECVCTGPFNAGIYATVRERGDVKGIFVGHDHVNNYHGNYHGVYLGYAASAGFGTYGLSGAETHRMRGVRVFDIDESNREVFQTHMVLASDLGVCTKQYLTDCPGYGASASSARIATAAATPAPGEELDGVDVHADLTNPETAATYEVKGERIVGKRIVSSAK